MEVHTRERPMSASGMIQADSDDDEVSATEICFNFLYWQSLSYIGVRF